MRDDDWDPADDPIDPEDDIYADDAEIDCGVTDGGLCMYAGTEHCDFDCPFRDEI